MSSNNTISIKLGKSTTGREIVGLSSPYLPACAERARALGGKWNVQQRVWIFDARDERRVRDLAVELYGTDDSATCETVDVRVALDTIIDGYAQVATAVGRVLASRPSRDHRVDLGDGVIVIEGGFPASGGSVRNPRLEPENGTILEVRDVPASFAASLPEGVSIVAGDDSSLSDQERELVAQLQALDPARRQLVLAALSTK